MKPRMPFNFILRIFLGFRPVAVLGMAAVLMLFFAAPAFSYEEDTHFIITYVLCRSAGFEHDEALTVAAVDQGMDDSKDVNAHNGAIPQIAEEWLWHALDRNGEMQAAGIVARRDELFKAALDETDPRVRLVRLGIFFHYQQDTWAHRHHDDANHLSPNNFTTFNTPEGHGPWGSKPDRPPLDPVAALSSLEDGIVYAETFLKRALNRKPVKFLAGYRPSGGSVDPHWKDKRRGKFFNRLSTKGLKADSPHMYLKTLINAQIEAYTRKRDYNPFYAPKKTPNRADLAKVRENLQEICDKFEKLLGKIEIPTEEDKVAQGFTEMTTAGLLSLGNDADKANK